MAGSKAADLVEPTAEKKVATKAARRAASRADQKELLTVVPTVVY